MKDQKFGTPTLKEGFAKMQKGGVIMDVTSVEHAQIAEESGAVAVMALERVPADIRAHGGIARMADPELVSKIMQAVSIPVMAKVRIGHFVEAQVLEHLGVDMIDESEVLTPADPFFHINKRQFTVPFVCGCRMLAEAVRRIWEGAAMIRTKGEAGTGNIIEAIRHQRMVATMIAKLALMSEAELMPLAESYAQSYVTATTTLEDQPVTDASKVFYDYSYAEVKQGLLAVLQQIRNQQRLPVVNFAAGGIATPADAAIMMQLGSDGVFVGSGIFKSHNPLERAKAIVEATTHYNEPAIIAQVSRKLGEGMSGIAALTKEQLFQDRGN